MMDKELSDYRIGIDLGGTKIEGVVLDAKGRVLFRERIPTGQEKGYDHILLCLREIYDQMKHRIADMPHTLGLATPGAFSKKTGFLKNSNTLCLNGRLCHRDLERVFDHPVAVENDANCFAMAEALFGAGAGYNLVFGVILGTGCGGGIVYKGELIRGPQAIAGEWGHMVLDPSGPRCYCGASGCVETFISGGGLESSYERQFGRRLELQEIIKNYRNQDSEALGFMKEFFAHFGQALANLINILDPDIVVLGGGVSNIDELYAEGVEAVRRRVFSDELLTPITRHVLGDSAGVLGAAAIGKGSEHEAL